MKVLDASSPDEWRAWLAEHYQSESEIWLVIANKAAAGVHYAEAVEQALCFGWIDSHGRKDDAQRFVLRFTPRRPRSRWSPTNLRRAAKMIELGLMTEWGQAAMGSVSDSRNS